MKNTKPNFDKIKAAIYKNCGGFQDATNEQLLIKWNSLTEELKEQYLKSTAPSDFALKDAKS